LTAQCDSPSVTEENRFNKLGWQEMCMKFTAGANFSKITNTGNSEPDMGDFLQLRRPEIQHAIFHNDMLPLTYYISLYWYSS
jgi:hypothetical protein